MTGACGDEPAFTPERIGRFRILEALGRGAIGPAYVAHDPERDCVVRLEVWSDPEDDADERRRLHDEAQAMAHVSHPNVVPVLEVGMDERHVFIAKSRVRGEDLHLVLRRRRLSVGERVALFAGIARGLHAVHEAGLASLDFTPHKVVLAPDTQPLLTEFGVARDRTPSARYMSPEQIAPRPLTPASDQFSFGIALYEALHCRHPFVHTDVASLHAAVLGGHTIPWDGRGVSAHLQAVVMRCLQTNPKARFESMNEVAEALEGGTRSARPLLALAVLSAFGLAVAACVQLA